MRRWQPLLELLFYHASMVDPLGSKLPLGCSRVLPLAAWRFPFLWFWSTEVRVVLGSISWQSGFPLFVLGHFFLLGMGLRPDMKWAGFYQILQPHNSPSKSCCPALQTERRVLMSSGLYHGRLSLVPLWEPGPLHLPNARSWRFSVRDALSSILLWDDTNRFGIRNVHSMAPLWSGADLAVEGSLENWVKFISLDIPFLSFVRDELPQISSPI